MLQHLQENALQALSESGAVREVLVSRQDEKWTLAIRLSGNAARWLLVRSRREPVRTWTSLSAVARYLEWLNLRDFRAEL